MRRIQTAVLGGARSDIPLILPLEAIEVEAFRREHAADTFWCGLLLGGCGSRLATKLYTDRVCHFAHFPDSDGAHVCERRARDVASADHLYATAAARTWLHAQGHRATVRHGTPLGSVVDLHPGPRARGLRLHLDAAIAPVWDDERTEPVLGVSVPVDDRTLVDRRYVHRVRFDSVGTARRVRIGTQSFARGTEWFALDDCTLTPEGLHTPAVERITRARTTTAREGLWRPPAPASRKDHTPPELRLQAAIASGSRLAVLTACREIEAAGLHESSGAEPVAAALERARAWLDGQRRERLRVLEQLRQAVHDGAVDAVSTLLERVDRWSLEHRSQEERDTVAAAMRLLGTHRREQETRATQERQEAKRRALQADGNGRRQPVQERRTRPDRAAAPAGRPAGPLPRSRQPDAAAAAHRRMQDILRDLRRLGTGLGPRTLTHLLRSLSTALNAAGDRVTPQQRQEAEDWLRRGRRLRGAIANPAPETAPTGSDIRAGSRPNVSAGSKKKRHR
ncbi:hypothetical protein ACFV4M_26875 [Kitasatospora indigofera]|uniref:hypothetical protein n=1 Tax=Kitasatospora indigofera TaxID=67307 RepID=UPI00366432E9